MDNDDINQGVIYDDWYCLGNLYDNIDYKMWDFFIHNEFYGP